MSGDKQEAQEVIKKEAKMHMTDKVGCVLPIHGSNYVKC